MHLLAGGARSNLWAKAMADANDRMEITIPPGLAPGSPLMVQAPDGRKMQITVPPGMNPGQKLQVQLPAKSGAGVGLTPPAMSVDQGITAKRNSAVKKNPKMRMNASAPTKGMSGASSDHAAEYAAVSASQDALEQLMFKLGNAGISGIYRPDARQLLEKHSNNVTAAYDELLQDHIIGDRWQPTFTPKVRGAEARQRASPRRTLPSAVPLKTAPSLSHTSQDYAAKAKKQANAQLGDAMPDVMEFVPPKVKLLRAEMYLPPKIIAQRITKAEFSAPKLSASARAAHFLPPNEARQIRHITEGMKDITSNAQLRKLEEYITTRVGADGVPQSLTRAQTCAILRTMENPLRRKEGVDMLNTYGHLDSGSQELREELEAVSWPADITLLCGDKEGQYGGILAAKAAKPLF